jgi:hypothetical protein
MARSRFSIESKALRGREDHTVSKFTVAAAVETARSLVPLALNRGRPLAVRAPLICPVVDVIAPEYGVLAIDKMSHQSWRSAGLRRPHYSESVERLAADLDGARLVVLADLEAWVQSKLEFARCVRHPVLAVSMVRGDEGARRFRHNAKLLDAIVVDALDATVRL